MKTKSEEYREKTLDLEENSLNVLLVDLKNYKDFELLDTIQNNVVLAYSIIPSTKILKITDFWLKIVKNQEYIHTLFVDDALINHDLVDLNEFSGLKYITLSSKTKPRDFEMLFHKYSQLGVDGINFDIETLSKGQVSLCHKFNLLCCAHSIIFDRHLEKAKELNLDSIEC